MADTKKAMNMGGTTGMAKKTRLVEDLNAAFKNLNSTLEKTKRLSEGIAKDLKAAMGGGGGSAASSMSPDLTNTMGYAPQTAVPPSKIMPTGFLQQGSIKPGESSSLGFVQPKQRGTFLPALGSAAGSLAQATLMASIQAIDPSQYIENDIARKRAGFYMGVGGQRGATQAGIEGGKLFSGMMSMGTATDPLDAARAVMNGASMGMMTGLSNYSTIAGNAAMFSNLTPGVGLQGGMQATAALNQAGNVNRLRMIGIEVRDPSTGLMNSVERIANQIWTYLNKIKTGGGNITASDISLSLQPGNSLDGMLNQYFGNDEVLRQGVIAILYQKAGGKSTSQRDLIKTGASSEVAQSFGQRYAGEYNAVNAYTKSGVQGVTDANYFIRDAANTFAGAVDVFGGYVQIISGAKTLATGANGGAGTIMGDLISSAGSVIGAGWNDFLKNKFSDMFSGMFGKIADKVLGTGIKGGPAGGGGATGGFAAPNWLANAAKFVGSTAGSAATGLTAAAAAYGSSMVELHDKDPEAFAALVKDQVTNAKANSTNGVFSPLEFLTGAYIPKDKSYTGYSTNGLGDSSPLMSGLSVPTDGEFGNRASFRTQPHRGVDFVAKEGTSVFAIKSGKVLKAGWEGDLGNMVRIEHPDGTRTVYGHLKSQLVSEGQSIVEGSQIALSGNTGRSTGPHLHVALEDQYGSVSDPMAILGGATTPTGGTNGSAGMYQGNSLFSNSGGTLFKNGLGDSSPTMGGGGGGTYYGGVTVHINVPQGTAINETKLAREVKRILEDQEQLRMAVVR